jgi:hypothetical protein
VERASTRWFRVTGEGQSYFASSTTGGIVNIAGVSGGTSLAIGTSGSTTVLNFLPGTSDFNIRTTGTGAINFRHTTAGNALQGTWDGSFLFQPPTGTTTTVPGKVRRRASQTGNLWQFESEAPATLSYFDKDGIYNGPAVFTTASVIDNAFSILDDLDATKIAQFQCASLAAGTNTFTFPATTAGTFAIINLAQTFTKTQTFQPDTNGDVAGVFKEKSGSTANLLELRDSSGGIHVSLDRATYGTPVLIIGATTDCVPIIYTTTAFGPARIWGAITDDGATFMNLTLDAAPSGADLTFPGSGGTVVTTLATQTLANKTLGGTVFFSTTAATLGQFRDASDSTKRWLIRNNSQSTGTTVTFTSSATGNRTFTFPDVTGNAAVRTDSVDLTGQSASIGATNLVATPITGMYLISAYMTCTTAGDAGDGVTVAITWNDGTAAQTATVAPCDLATINNKGNGTYNARVASGTAIQYSTTLTSPGAGTPVHTLYMRATLI